jgi:hypothetical protein
MENHLVEGSYMWQMAGGSFNPHQKVPNGSGGTSADFGGFGYTTENVNSPEQTKAFKDLIAYLTSPQYFKGIDFSVDEAIDESDDGGKKNKGKAEKDIIGDKLNWFNLNDDGLYLFAKNTTYTPNNMIRVFAHGNSKGIQGPNGKMIYFADKFDDVLKERSPSWKEFRDEGNKGRMILDLRACNTGSVEYSFAHQLSMDPRFKGVVIIAPADYFIAYPDGKKAFVGGPGNYNLFLNGKLVRGKYNTKH